MDISWRRVVSPTLYCWTITTTNELIVVIFHGIWIFHKDWFMYHQQYAQCGPSNVINRFINPIN